MVGRIGQQLDRRLLARAGPGPAGQVGWQRAFPALLQRERSGRRIVGRHAHEREGGQLRTVA